MSGGDVWRTGKAAEPVAMQHLTALGYWVEKTGQTVLPDRVRASLVRTRSAMRYWVDLYCGIPGIQQSTRLVDVKSTSVWTRSATISIEISPLLLALSGVMGPPVYFMHKRQWTPAYQAWRWIRLWPDPHCCPDHFEALLHLDTDDPGACLAMFNELPEKCRSTRGSGDPYIVVDPQCMTVIPPALNGDTA